MHCFSDFLFYFILFHWSLKVLVLPPDWLYVYLFHLLEIKLKPQGPD